MRVELRKNARRIRRAKSVRAKLRRTSNSQRLSVNRSLKHMAAQIIDDASGRTLCSVSSTARSLASELEGKTKCERAAAVGRELARRAKDAGVETVVFDRGRCKYHGRVRALADAAREGGLKF